MQWSSNKCGFELGGPSYLEGHHPHNNPRTLIRRTWASEVKVLAYRDGLQGHNNILGYWDIISVCNISYTINVEEGQMHSFPTKTKVCRPMNTLTRHTAPTEELQFDTSRWHYSTMTALRNLVYNTIYFNTILLILKIVIHVSQKRQGVNPDRIVLTF